jgi:protein AATF/BFR2
MLKLGMYCSIFVVSYLILNNSKSKLRKSEEVALGPQYAGSRISRERLLNDDDDVELDSDAEGSGSEDEDANFADPDDSEIDIDVEDGDIDSDAAFGESDSEKFKDFTFRGSGRPRENGNKKRPTAADFMSESEGEDEGAPLNGDESGEEETDEDILDTARQHSEDSENEVFSTARQSLGDEGSDEEDSDRNDSEDEGSEGSDEDDGTDLTPDEDSEVAGDSENSDDDDEGDKKAKRSKLRKIMDDDPVEVDDDRAGLRRIMNDEKKSVVATISQSAKADVEKGNAVKQQRKAFDSLLSVRMVLQKALVATNSMAVNEEKDSDDSDNQPYEAAEEAAVKLWNTLDGLRHDLSKAKTGAGQKRKRGVDTSTPSSTLWERMQNSEVSMINTRQTTLEKWSAKFRPTDMLAKERKLKQTTTQSITSVLQDHLANSDHLVRKTKMPRSCAPLQRDLKITEDPNIYDDGNFYQLLLKELVDQRRVESLTTPAAGAVNGAALQWTAVKEAKTKKNVDTKASKGRKMRYTVHEKLQNFMAPEDRGKWEPEAIDRFFGTLLGQKMTLGEDDMEVDEDEDVPVEEISIEEEGLKLFRSS